VKGCPERLFQFQIKDEIKAARIAPVEFNPGLQDSFRLELNTEIPVFKRRLKYVVKYLGQTISTQLQRRTRYEGK